MQPKHAGAMAAQLAAAAAVAASKEAATPRTCCLHERVTGCSAGATLYPASNKSKFKEFRYFPAEQFILASTHTAAHKTCIRAAEQRHLLTDDERNAALDIAARREAADVALRELLQHPPPSGAATPLARSVGSVQEAAAVFRDYDFAVVRGNATAAALVPRVLAALRKHEKRLLRSCDVIGGTVVQLRMDHIGTAEWASLRAELSTLFKDIARSLGVPDELLQRTTVLEFKILRATAPAGLQPIHWDVTSAQDAPEDKITFLLHCNSSSPAGEVLTTAMPLFRSRVIFPRSSLTDYNEYSLLRAVPSQAHRAFLAARSPLLTDAWFHAIPAQLGDVTVCRQFVPHRGTKCGGADGKHTRTVLFGMLSADAASAEQDAFQWYPWQYAEWAHGRGSAQHLEQIMYAREHGWNPLERIPDERVSDWMEIVKHIVTAGHAKQYWPERGGAAPSWAEELAGRRRQHPAHDRSRAPSKKREAATSHIAAAVPSDSASVAWNEPRADHAASAAAAAAACSLPPKRARYAGNRHEGFTPLLDVDAPAKASR